MKKLILMLLGIIVGALLFVAGCSEPIAGQAIQITGEKCSSSYICKDDGSVVSICKSGKVIKYSDDCIVKGTVANDYSCGVDNSISIKPVSCSQSGKKCVKGKCVAPVVCDANNLNLCTTQSACTAVGYWSNNVCVASCPVGTEAGADKVCVVVVKTNVTNTSNLVPVSNVTLNNTVMSSASCDKNNLGLCTTYGSCIDKSGYWNGGYCVSSCPAGKIADGFKNCIVPSVVSANNTNTTIGKSTNTTGY